MEWVWVRFPNESDVEDVVSFKDLFFEDSPLESPKIGDEVIVNWKDEKSKKIDQVPAVIVRFGEDKKKLIDMFNGNDCISPSQLGKLKRKRRLPERMCSSSDEDVQIESNTKRMKLQAKKKVKQNESETLSKILEERVQSSHANQKEESLAYKLICMEKENTILKEENKKLKEENNTLAVLKGIVSELKLIMEDYTSKNHAQESRHHSTPQRQKSASTCSTPSFSVTASPLGPIYKKTGSSGETNTPDISVIDIDDESSDASPGMVNIGPGLIITRQSYSKLDYKTMNGLVCSTLDAALTREFMASRSLKGQKPNSMADTTKLKPGLCADMVKSLIDFVLRSGVKDRKGREAVASSVKECIRQKLANEAKGLKKCEKNSE